MIIFDVETSGLVPGQHQLLSIGAVLFEGSAEFYQEACVPEEFRTEEHINAEALEYNGFAMQDITDPDKPSPQTMAHNFVQWCRELGIHGKSLHLGGWNVHFDINFLKANLHDETNWPFGYRYMDVGALAWAFHGAPIGSSKIADRLLIPREPMPHTALNGAKQARKVLYALMARLR